MVETDWGVSRSGLNGSGQHGRVVMLKIGIVRLFYCHCSVQESRR